MFIRSGAKGASLGTINDAYVRGNLGDHYTPPVWLKLLLKFCLAAVPDTMGCLLG